MGGFSGLAHYGNKLAEYMEGPEGERQELTPVGGGDAIPFKFDDEVREMEPTDGGAVVTGSVIIYVRQEVDPTTLYTWNGATWTLTETGAERTGSAAWPYRVELERHVQ